MSTLKTILFVEDDADIRKIGRLALEHVGGFELQLCSSGQEALEKGPAFAPDLLLLDVMMPDMDGPTTLARLHEIPALAKTPAIFMTAKAQPEEIKALRALGALGVIAKPFDPMQLANQVEAIWEGRDG